MCIKKFMLEKPAAALGEIGPGTLSLIALVQNR